MCEVHHFILNELQVAIRHCVPLAPLLDDLVHYGLITLHEKDTWRGKKGMRSLISKLRGRDFESFNLFVKCILEVGQRESSVQTVIVNSIRGAAEKFDEEHKTNFKAHIPQKFYDPELFDSDEDDNDEDKDSGCVSDAPTTPSSVRDRENSIEHVDNLDPITNEQTPHGGVADSIATAEIGSKDVDESTESKGKSMAQTHTC